MDACTDIAGTSEGEVMAILRRSTLRRFTFAAIDFETATDDHTSVCAIGVTIVDRGKIVDSFGSLVRPPSNKFIHSRKHGITWEDVKDEPHFGKVWRNDFRDVFSSMDFIAAHNAAAFERHVLVKSCIRYKIRPPRLPLICTMMVARRGWGIKPTTLPDVCEELGIKQGRHHHPVHDARASANIMREAMKVGWYPKLIPDAVYSLRS